MGSSQIWFEHSLQKTSGKLRFYKPLVHHTTDDFGRVSVKVESVGGSSTLNSDVVDEIMDILKNVAVTAEGYPVEESDFKLESVTDFKLELFGSRLFVTFKAMFNRE